MKIPYFCCIGAELKRYAKDFDFMNQVYLYKVPTDDSIEEVLAEDYFKAISDSVLQDDILYIYEASAETLHSCRFDKQNGHITAVPLASDETLTGAVTTIIHDNLTPNKLLKSDENGKVAASDLNEDEIANTDLSNLTSIGANIGNWSSNVTNCITEIPQDIKLELNNGALTLKAGSKVYVPNGAGNFDVRNITSDTTLAVVAPNEKILVCVNQNNVPAGRYLSASTSGPGATATSGFAYDTTTNIISFYNSSGTMQSTDYSFPIAIVTSDSNGAISSIDQVFNGFGYIGSTVFVLPGVKGLIPNGRNADGTLKNVAWTSSQVIVRTFTGMANNTLFFDGSAFAILTSRLYEYKEPENINWDNYGQQKYVTTYIGLLSTTTGGVITHFNPKTDFHAVDYNDGNYIASCAMPSNKYIDLTLGTDGSTYTAPADGYMVFHKGANAAGQRIGLTVNTGARNIIYSSGANQYMAVTIPIQKGNVVTINYTAGVSETTAFRFVYANGSK